MSCLQALRPADRPTGRPAGRSRHLGHGGRRPRPAPSLRPSRHAARAALSGLRLALAGHEAPTRRIIPCLWSCQKFAAARDDVRPVKLDVGHEGVMGEASHSAAGPGRRAGSRGPDRPGLAGPHPARLPALSGLRPTSRGRLWKRVLEMSLRSDVRRPMSRRTPANGANLRARPSPPARGNAARPRGTPPAPTPSSPARR
jgi:hypothetical protein